DEGFMLLEIGRHLIERSRERAEFVLRSHRHSRAEVATGELAHALRKAREMLRHAVRDRNDAYERKGDDEQAKSQVLHRRTSDVPQRGADGSRDAENDAARRLARDDDPVTGTARRAFGCDGCGALDSKRLQPFIVRRVLRVECALTIYRERYFTLIPSSKA